MASSTTTVYVVTGTNRGIGYSIVAQLAARPDSLVYAGARDPSKADKLQQLAKQHSNVRLLQLSAESDADHAAAAKRVEAEAGRVDVLLANAATLTDTGLLRTDKLLPAELRDHFEVNTAGPVRLFTAFFSLLTRSFNPKFAVVSSSAGSITIQPHMSAWPTTIYGSSKAAINFIVQRIHVEHPTITAFPLNPGFVETDMSQRAVRGAKNVEVGPPISTEQSAESILKLLDVATRDTHSGKFWNAQDAKELPW